jgi:cell division protease FtsH
MLSLAAAPGHTKDSLAALAIHGMRAQQCGCEVPGKRAECSVMKTKRPLWPLLNAIVIAALVLYLLTLMDKQRSSDVVAYSQFEQALQSGRIARVVITDKKLFGYLKPNDAEHKDVLITNRVEPDLSARLTQFKVPYSRAFDSGWFTVVLGWVVPVAIFALAWYLMFRSPTGRQGIGGLTSLGKSRAKVMLEKSTGVTFADVAGVDEAKEELHEVVDFLKDPQRYGRLGAHIPKGVLLVGPPGTGKTLLARALAGEAGVAFLSTNGAEFVEMFVGVGAARVRDLFEQARACAPAIIFIDELDALGRARGAYAYGGSDEKEQTLNQLLAEMDGFDMSAGVIMLAATNRPEILDPALLRAGRFDRQVLVDRPDLKGRLDVLKVHAKKVTLAADADLAKVAGMTPGFAGADLANVINEAALLATRRGAEAVTLEDFTAAIERIVAGLEKRTRLLNPNERRTVAYHEMGHALVAMSLPGTDPVQKVSIIPRGISALGYTIQRPTEDRFLMTREELQARMTVMLGGRAAEMLVFGVPSTGAADDLVKATTIARASVARYGMNPKIGMIAYEEETHPMLRAPTELPPARRYSEETAREIDCAVRDAIQDAYQSAVGILAHSRAVLEEGARLLMEKETLTEPDLQALRKSLSRGSGEAAKKEDELARIDRLAVGSKCVALRKPRETESP